MRPVESGLEHHGTPRRRLLFEYDDTVRTFDGRLEQVHGIYDTIALAR